MSVTRRFKGYFLHGLAVLLPSILTIWLFVWGYTFIQEKISIHINRGLVHIIALAANDSVEISDEDVREYLLETKPELKGNARIVETATPVTFNRYTGTYDGSIYGVKQTVNQRALNTITSIRGLYLAGQSITPGVLGAVVSGVMAVSKIIDPGEFWNKVRNCR